MRYNNEIRKKNWSANGKWEEVNERCRDLKQCCQGGIVNCRETSREVWQRENKLEETAWRSFQANQSRDGREIRTGDF